MRAALVVRGLGRGTPLARHAGKRSRCSSKSAAPSAKSCSSYWTSPAWCFIKSGGTWGGSDLGFGFGVGPGPGAWGLGLRPAPAPAPGLGPAGAGVGAGAGAEWGTLSARELVSCECGTGRCVQPKRLLSTQADSLRRDVIPTKRYLHSKCRIAQRRCAGPAPHAPGASTSTSAQRPTPRSTLTRGCKRGRARGGRWWGAMVGREGDQR